MASTETEEASNAVELESQPVEDPEETKENQDQPPQDETLKTEEPIEKEKETAESYLQVKHPLQYKWCLWFLKNERGLDWEECLKDIASFDTVEDFWALYNHVQLPSMLPMSTDYYIFKDGIKPMWEDLNNKQGGRWLIQIPREAREHYLDQYWLEILMAMLGEQFDDMGEHICGAVLNVRNKGDKISLWTSDQNDEEINIKIGRLIKAKLGLSEDRKIQFDSHESTSQKQSSKTNPKHTL